MQYLEFIDLNYINLFIAFILLFILILYNKKITNESIEFRFLLIFLRFFTISVLLLLLFNPVILQEELDNRIKISFLIDNSKSIDNWKDIAAGKASGCRTVLIKKVYNKNVDADHYVQSLTEATEIITSI